MVHHGPYACRIGEGALGEACEFLLVQPGILTQTLVRIRDYHTCDSEASYILPNTSPGARTPKRHALFHLKASCLTLEPTLGPEFLCIVSKELCIDVCVVRVDADNVALGDVVVGEHDAWSRRNARHADADT